MQKFRKKKFGILKKCMKFYQKRLNTASNPLVFAKKIFAKCKIFDEIFFTTIFFAKFCIVLSFFASFIFAKNKYERKFSRKVWFAANPNINSVICFENGKR